MEVGVEDEAQAVPVLALDRIESGLHKAVHD
jgi:hypothetical protein